MLKMREKCRKNNSFGRFFPVSNLNRVSLDNHYYQGDICQIVFSLGEKYSKIKYDIVVIIPYVSGVV